jgi:V8-like Glu-specific endopeptidase
MQVKPTTVARHVVGLAVAVTATVATALAMPASAADTPVDVPLNAATSTAEATTTTGAGTVGSAARAQVSTYWTAARMRSATPMKAIPTPATGVTPELKALGAAGTTAAVAGPPSAAALSSFKALPVGASLTVGRVFFSNPVGTVNVSVGNHSCSGSALNSGSKQLVITAGHCVHGGAGGAYYDNWIFIPAYDNGNQPYGQFAAKQFRTFNTWTDSSDFGRDVSMVTTYPNDSGAVVNVVGGNGLAWNFPKSLPITILAYPVDPPFTGTDQQYCSGTTMDLGSTIGLRCNFTGGSSGAPWLKDYDGSTGLVNGAMSTLRTDGTNAASYFDTAVKEMLDAQGDVT